MITGSKLRRLRHYVAMLKVVQIISRSHSLGLQVSRSLPNCGFIGLRHEFLDKRVSGKPWDLFGKILPEFIETSTLPAAPAAAVHYLQVWQKWLPLQPPSPDDTGFQAPARQICSMLKTSRPRV